MTTEATKVVTAIALTGFMGAGKSSVGKALAAGLGWPFFDLDEQIERRLRSSIEDLFRTQGEPAFRQIETQTLQAVLNLAETSFVLALGGGTFVQPQNTDLLVERSVTVVYLDAPLDLLIQRCCVTEGATRPLASDPSAFVRLYHERLPRYHKADVVVPCGGKTIDQVAEEIARSLHLRLRSGEPVSESPIER